MSIASKPSNKESVTAGKLLALRKAMALHQLDGYLIPSVDEHINEYLPQHRERRAWASGFTGSAGDFLVTCEQAWLFVDSRYHEQAGYEVATGQVSISKLGLEGQSSVSEKVKELASKLPHFRLGYDPYTLSQLQAQAFSKAFANTNIELMPVLGNLIDPLWTDAPAPGCSEVFALPEAVSGKAWTQKLTEMQAALKAQNADVLPLTKLDQIAWLFNLRGQDIPYNPVFMAYAIVTSDQAYLFMDASRVQPAALSALKAVVTVLPYEDYVPQLAELSQGKRVLIDPKHTTAGTVHTVETHHGLVIEAEHPVELAKAVKNPAEMKGMQQANLQASRGKIRAWHWLDGQIAAGNTVTEESFRQAIEAFYAEEPGFFGLSFNTISGAGANSSIVHYGTPDPNKKLEPGELFLIDSGCQFCGPDFAEPFAGTTDDTRTLFVGNGTPTALQKQRYTAVLKAHIACARQIFPKGTEGARLDGITRAAMWNLGLDYGHGTGHGVGAFLNVHEGPNGIHKLASKAFAPGMITSIEPGYYEPGWGGIRLENLYRCVEVQPGFYGFESLIYIPFDQKLIDFAALSAEELNWLQAYYAAILEKLLPTLNTEEQVWLKAMCAI